MTGLLAPSILVLVDYVRNSQVDNISVNRIFSGAHFSPKQLMAFFQSSPSKYRLPETNKLTTLTIQISPDFLKNCLFLCLEGALTTFPYKFGPQFFSPPGSARAPSAPPGYAYA